MTSRKDSDGLPSSSDTSSFTFDPFCICNTMVLYVDEDGSILRLPFAELKIRMEIFGSGDPVD